LGIDRKGFAVPHTNKKKTGPAPQAARRPVHSEPEREGNEVGQRETTSPREPPPEDLADVETRLRVTKLSADLDKLQLEKRSLERQLSWQGVALSWLQGATVLVAIIGIGTTLYLGQQQTRVAVSAAREQAAQAEENRAADRFDKALGRLANQNDVGVRLSGVAGLRLFLSDGNSQHQSEAVHYLITAVANEKSQEVQQAIVDAFRESKRFGQQAKDEALRTALELNRSATATLVREIHQQRTKAERELFASFLPNPPDNWSNSYLWRKDLTFLQNMQLDTISAKSLFYDPTTSCFRHEKPDDRFWFLPA
jgi:hypothetical protein